MLNSSGVSGEEKIRVWDSYWQDNRLYCAGPDADAEMAAALDAHWQQAMSACASGARILDLACGNGSVTLAVARAAGTAAKSVSIEGIDSADIDPKRHVPQYRDVTAEVKFLARTQMESLPFPNDSFDAVFSQFGLEFGQLEPACTELVRVLKPGGVVSILATSVESTFVAELGRKAKQSGEVLVKTKLFEIAAAVVQGISVFETKGEGREPQQYLEKWSDEVERALTKVRFDDVGQATLVVTILQDILARRKSTSLPEQLAAIEDFKVRFTRHAARSEAVARAALGYGSAKALARRLNDAGVAKLRTEPMNVPNAGTVAWRISASEEQVR